MLIFFERLKFLKSKRLFGLGIGIVVALNAQLVLIGIKLYLIKIKVPVIIHHQHGGLVPAVDRLLGHIRDAFAAGSNVFLLPFGLVGFGIPFCEHQLGFFSGRAAAVIVGGIYLGKGLHK